MFLLTGISGYIGSHYLSYLTSIGQKVVSLSGTEFYNMGREDEEDFVTSVVGKQFLVAKQCIFINAGWKDVKRQHCEQIDYEFIEKQIRLHKILMKIGVEKFVNIGTCYEYGRKFGGVTPNCHANPITSYAIEKFILYRRLTELFNQNTNAQLMWMRAFYVYGGLKQNNNIFDAIKQSARRNETKFHMTKADQLLDFIHIEDLVKSSINLLSESNIHGLINASSGRAKRLRTVIEKFIYDNELNLKIEYGALPYREHESMALWGEKPFELFEHKVE